VTTRMVAAHIRVEGVDGAVAGERSPMVVADRQIQMRWHVNEVLGGWFEGSRRQSIGRIERVGRPWAVGDGVNEEVIRADVGRCECKCGSQPLEDARRSAGRLAVAVPLSIALILILLYLNFGSATDMLLAASVMPMALVGGIFALAITGTPFSVSAAIGFVALFGIAAMDGIIVLNYYNQQIASGIDRVAALERTGETQMRPVVMTCLVACVGLLPAAISTGIGAQVQRPLAIVVVGGILLAPVLILLVLPVLISLFSRRRASAEPLPETAPAEAKV